MQTGEVTRKRVLEGWNIEFPTYNLDLVGKRTRYIYLPYSNKQPKQFSCQAEKDNEYFTGFFKFDTETDKIVKKVDFDDNMTAGEIIY